MLGIIQLRSKPWLLSGNELFASPAYMVRASPHCLQLLAQSTLSALALAFARAGNNKAARMAMMAMTTSSSMSVNARQPGHPRGTDERIIRIIARLLKSGGIHRSFTPRPEKGKCAFGSTPGPNAPLTISRISPQNALTLATAISIGDSCRRSPEPHAETQLLFWSPQPLPPCLPRPSDKREHQVLLLWKRFASLAMLHATAITPTTITNGGTAFQS